MERLPTLLDKHPCNTILDPIAACWWKADIHLVLFIASKAKVFEISEFIASIKESTKLTYKQTSR